MKRLGFGCMRLPLTDADNPESIDFTALCMQFDRFLEKGFTYFDTAYPYHNGCSETAIRECLVKRHPRDSFLLADKMPSYIITCPEDYPRLFAEQLERCGVEYFDYYLMHNLGKPTYPVCVQCAGMDFLRKIKAEGKARRIGFSFHDEPELLDQILTENPDLDFVQLQLNYADWERPGIHSRRCYEIARKHGKPVIVMEPIKGGMLANLPEEAKRLLNSIHPERSDASWALRFIASKERIEMVLSGMNTLEQIEENTSVVEGVVAEPFTDQENKALEEVVEILRKSVPVPCTGCQYCVEHCPQKINIPALFTVYNTFHETPKVRLAGMQYLRQTYGRGCASMCLGCKACERHCPQHLHISELMKTIAQAME